MSKKAIPRGLPAAHAVCDSDGRDTHVTPGAGLWAALSLYFLADSKEPEDESQLLCLLSQKASEN